MNDLMKTIEEIESMTPKNGSDYCMGYHTALMYVKRAIRGDSPFEFTFNWQKVTIESQDE